ncbi:MAG: O-antigen ligase family protein, partial [Gaiellaceae bacterium]
SVTWAASRGSAISSSQRYLLDLLLLPIVYFSVRSRAQVRWIIMAFLLGAAVSGAYGLVHPVSQTNQDYGRLAGTIGDANTEATAFVVALALAVGLLAARDRGPKLRLFTFACAGICVVGLLQTLSRAGLLSFAAMLVAGCVFGGRWRARAAVLLTVAVAGTAGYFLAIAPLAARQRITSQDTSGRADIWQVGWRMFSAHPLQGVGAGNFQTSSIHYLVAPGAIHRADLIVNTPKVAHNIYLELLADLGVPGLLALLGVLLGALAAAARAAWLFQRSNDRELELISRAVVLSVLAFMVADFFVSDQFSKQLWLVLALGPAVLKLAHISQAGEVV